MTENEKIEADNKVAAILISTTLLAALLVILFGTLAYQYGYWHGVAVGAKVVPATEGR